MHTHVWNVYPRVHVCMLGQECRQLAAKLLRWLRPGGHVFFRESCFHASGAAPMLVVVFCPGVVVPSGKNDD